MALLHHAELRPSKIELVEEWAPTQPWFSADASAGFATVAAYRFDDPDGEVGIETLLVLVGDGTLLHIPLTYRGAPLDGAGAWLAGTMQHEVLGDRWVYDATGDPVYLAALATAILTGGTQAEQYFEEGGRRVPRALNTFVKGSGTDARAAVLAANLSTVSTRHESTATVATSGDLRVTVARVLFSPTAGNALDAESTGDAERLTGTWTDHPVPTTFATVDKHRATS